MSVPSPFLALKKDISERHKNLSRGCRIRAENAQQRGEYRQPQGDGILA